MVEGHHQQCRTYMTSGNNNIYLRKAIEADLPNIKSLADQHKTELGFIIRGALLESINRGELVVAVNYEAKVLGFIHYRHRRDGQTTLYSIVTDSAFRSQGLGKKLVEFLKQDAIKANQMNIRLKCPEELPANEFYEHCGFRIESNEEGKHRRLNIWYLSISIENIIEQN